MNMNIFIHRSKKWRPPSNAVEYFTVLYCDRRKIGCSETAETMEAWKSLSPTEQKVFIDKFEKWQATNDKKITSILEHAEPFLRKKANKKQDRVKPHTNTTKEDYHANQQESTMHSSNSCMSGAISHANSEVSKRENLNIEFFMNDYDDDQSESTMHLVYDDTSYANSEVSKQHYAAASVIDTDIDEPIAQEETNENETAMNTALPEPTLSIVRAKELFGIIKRSGTRPELSTVEWKDLPAKEKNMYHRAVLKMKKDYLIKYEQYLESLPSPELFKHYIKFKSEN